MTHQLERKIETALERYFDGEEWSLDVITSTGDHIATRYVYDTELTVNLTECAKEIADEVATNAA